MPELRVPLDIYNVAQYYACLGMLSIYDLLHPEAELFSCFELEDGSPDAQFVVTGEASLELQDIVDCLRTAQVKSRDDAPVINSKGLPDKFIFPVELSIANGTVMLDWWLDEFWAEKSFLKLWGGPSKAFQMLETYIAEVPRELPGNPLDHFVPVKPGAGTSVFGFDWRTARDPLKQGYSLNEVGEAAKVYPITELLCAIGLTNYRPARQQNKETRERTLSYRVWRDAVPLLVTYAAAICPISGLRSKSFCAPIVSKNQGAFRVGNVREEDQAYRAYAR